MNKKLVVGNWKMNLTVPESTVLIEKLKKELSKIKYTEVVICPGFVDIFAASKELNGLDGISVGAQNMHYEELGPFTGEVSPIQLKNLAQYVIVGHSERRLHFNEGDKLIARKAEAAVAHGITPIICVGETLHEKNDGLSKVVVMNQVEAALAHMTAAEVAESVIAYEPIWAISTSGGYECKPDYVEKMVGYIRALIKALYREAASENIRIIYGGNVNEDNVAGFYEAKGVDGVLVGAASRDHKQFAKISKTFDKKPEAKAKQSVKKKVIKK